MSDDSRLIACLADVERHVGRLGWDQPARLFALVTTKELLALEPQLQDRVPDHDDDSLTAIEQEDFAGGDDLFERLAQIFWPETVSGVALAMERTFLPAEFEAEIPETDAEQFVAKHPSKVDVRVVVGVLRDRSQHGLARLKSNPDDLLGAPDLVPGLGTALMQTLEESS